MDVQAQHSEARTKIGGDGAQVGDVTTGQSAGRDIHQGLDGSQVLATLREIIGYLWADDQRRETRQSDLDRRLDRLTIWFVVMTGLIAAQMLLIGLLALLTLTDRL